MWEASKICSYSQEYLSLMARKKLIKAVKIDNKWFTKTVWIKEYLKDKKPEEIVGNSSQESSIAKKRKSNYFWLFFGLSALFLFIVIFLYREMNGKITQLENETRNLQTENLDKKTKYPFNLPGFADFFAPEKLEF
jgi:hypothetical protein